MSERMWLGRPAAVIDMAGPPPEKVGSPRQPPRKPAIPYVAIVGWVTLHAYILAITSLWFPRLSITAKAAITVSFAIGLALILAFYLGRRHQWRAWSRYLDKEAPPASLS
jgi:hypothetical protein